MNKISVLFTTDFYRELKTLLKKYRHIQNDLTPIIELIESGATPGDRIQGTGDYSVYKVRVPSSDMQRGKSGGLRFLYYLWTETKTIGLFIYAKTNTSDIPTPHILRLIAAALEELANETTSDDTPSDE